MRWIDMCDERARAGRAHRPSPIRTWGTVSVLVALAASIACVLPQSVRRASGRRDPSGRRKPPLVFASTRDRQALGEMYIFLADSVD